MHCEISDRQLNIFFVEIQLKKENLTSAFWAPEFRHPNRYIGFLDSLNRSMVRVPEGPFCMLLCNKETSLLRSDALILFSTTATLIG